MNFFDTTCQTGPFSALQFGLCDDQNGSMAYVDVTTPATWIATVNNPGAKDVMFTAIDKCVIKDGEEQGRGRCDCMLTTVDTLYLVELKDRGSGNWQEDAKRQLISTIDFLKKHHDPIAFKHRKAFACNKQSKPFVTLNNEAQLRFLRNHGFRLDIQTTILFKDS